MLFYRNIQYSMHVLMHLGQTNAFLISHNHKPHRIVWTGMHIIHLRIDDIGIIEYKS